MSMKALLVTVIFSLFGTSAFAAGDAGCGLGSVIISKNSKLLQLFALTTNGSFFSQGFGITSGTSNCSSNGLVQNERAIEQFVAVNQADLSTEMARGQGEKLNVLAALNGCGTDEAQVAFSGMTQKSFERIMTSADVKSNEVVQNLKKEMEKDSETARLCQVASL